MVLFTVCVPICLYVCVLFSVKGYKLFACARERCHLRRIWCHVFTSWQKCMCVYVCASVGLWKLVCLTEWWSVWLLTCTVAACMCVCVCVCVWNRFHSAAPSVRVNLPGEFSALFFCLTVNQPVSLFLSLSVLFLPNPSSLHPLPPPLHPPSPASLSLLASENGRTHWVASMCSRQSLCWWKCFLDAIAKRPQNKQTNKKKLKHLKEFWPCFCKTSWIKFCDQGKYGASVDQMKEKKHHNLWFAFCVWLFYSYLDAGL